MPLVHLALGWPSSVDGVLAPPGTALPGAGILWLGLVATLVLVPLLLAGRSAWRARERRRRDAEELQRVFGEVERALADPVLIHQARRRLRRWDARDA